MYFTGSAKLEMYVSDIFKFNPDTTVNIKKVCNATDAWKCCRDDFGVVYLNVD